MSLVAMCTCKATSLFLGQPMTVSDTVSPRNLNFQFLDVTVRCRSVGNANPRWKKLPYRIKVHHTPKGVLKLSSGGVCFGPLASFFDLRRFKQPEMFSEIAFSVDGRLLVMKHSEILKFPMEEFLFMVLTSRIMSFSRGPRLSASTISPTKSVYDHVRS